MIKYPNPKDFMDDYDYEKALSDYWTEVDRQHDEWKDDQLTEPKEDKEKDSKWNGLE